MQTPTYKFGERVISAISAGTFFILVGIIFVLALPSNLFERMLAFFSSLTTREFPGSTISLPAPSSPAAHAVLYEAVFQFCLGLAILQILLLMLRLVWRSPIGKTAETIGNFVFWSGASFLATTFLNQSTTVSMWFAFWAGMLVVMGVSLVIRALILLARR
jgi:hypothetical protein